MQMLKMELKGPLEQEGILTTEPLLQPPINLILADT